MAGDAPLTLEPSLFSVQGRPRGTAKNRFRYCVELFSLNDPEEAVVTIRPTWEMCLLVEPEAKAVLEHSHGWESDYLPD